MSKLTSSSQILNINFQIIQFLSRIDSHQNKNTAMLFGGGYEWIWYSKWKIWREQLSLSTMKSNEVSVFWCWIFFELVFYILSINFLIQFIFWGSLIMVLKLIESPEIFGINVIFRVCWTRSENNLKVTFEKM